MDSKLRFLHLAAGEPRLGDFMVASIGPRLHSKFWFAWVMTLLWLVGGHSHGKCWFFGLFFALVTILELRGLL